MNKVGILIATVTILLVGGGAYFLTKPKAPIQLPSYDESAHLYFWGNGCPHCEAVDEFFQSWEGKDKIYLQKFEVWYDKSNAELMSQKAVEICKLPQNQLSVPLLIKPNGECLAGDTPIIDYYKNLEF